MIHRKQPAPSVKRGWVESCLVLALVGFPATTFAQEHPARDPVGAEELFRQGVVAKNRGDWQTACDKFKKSFDLEPAVSTQYKLASCHEHAGRLASAWYGYQSALKMNRHTPSHKRQRELDTSIRAALAELEPRIPRLRIRVEPTAEGLELMRDGDSLAPASVLGEPLPVDPGEHTVAARAPGFTEQEVRVTVTEGRTFDVVLELVAAASSHAVGQQLPAPAAPARRAPALSKPLPTAAVPPAPSQPPQVAAVPPASALEASNSSAPQTGLRVPHQPQNGKPVDRASYRGWTQVQTAYVVGAAGIVSLLAAGYFGLRTLDYVSQMHDHRRDDGTYDGGVMEPRDRAVKSQTIGLVLAGAGAVLGAVGIGLYTTAPHGVARESRAWQVSPEATLTGVALSGRW